LARIFLSHSKEDREIRDFFLKIGGLAGVEMKAVEFEYFPPPAWEYIRNQLYTSDALFLLLGPNVLDRGIYTQNWISFEVGLACDMARTLEKDIWVFEQLQHPIRFPVPYLNHYVLYDPNNRTHLDYIRGIMEAYKPFPPLRRIPQGIREVACPYDDCKIKFKLHTDVKEFNCPTCRRGISLKTKEESSP